MTHPLTEALFQELIEELSKTTSADPVQLAPIFLNQFTKAGQTLMMLDRMGLTMTPEERHKNMARFIEAQLIAFKAKVQDELLATQEATNNALMDALAMKGGKS